MKYMGSKRLMLTNGLGKVIKHEIADTNRFVDLFSGSGSVAIHVAENYDVNVYAYDLQLYSSVITGAIIDRKSKIGWNSVWDNWYRNSNKIFKSYKIPSTEKITRTIVTKVREWCMKQDNLPITKAYGGHYFSPKQSVWIDSLRLSLPKEKKFKIIALSALIQAASKCAAAPGHTAQPFQPTRTAKKFLADAWNKNIEEVTKQVLILISDHCAKSKGKALVADANEAVTNLIEGDLVFIDPPYSGVHYSRFYHVLETIAKGSCGEVSGVGRYPDSKLRPRSKYSVKSESKSALNELLNNISSKHAKAILTFPDHKCSNGLSGEIVRETASKYFCVDEILVKSKFSTLGGKSNGEENVAGRSARQHAEELILILKPK